MILKATGLLLVLRTMRDSLTREAVISNIMRIDTEGTMETELIDTFDTHGVMMDKGIRKE